MRLERFYENTEILHVNTEPDRCYYLPCDAAGNSEQILLNGCLLYTSDAADE